MALVVADQSTPGRILEASEQAVELAQALDRLPEAQRQALVLQHWQAWTLQQIAEHMGKTRVAVAGLLKRGLKQLREETDVKIRKASRRGVPSRVLTRPCTV